MKIYYNEKNKFYCKIKKLFINLKIFDLILNISYIFLLGIEK